MNCQEVMELMQRSLDGDLDSRETSLMTEHIRTCPECADMQERLESLSNDLAQLPRVTPRFSIVDSILPQLDTLPIGEDSAEAAATETIAAASPSIAELAPGRADRPSRPGRAFSRRLAGAVAAGIVVGLLVISNPFSWLSHSSSDQDAASMPEASTAQSLGASSDASGSGANAMRKEMTNSKSLSSAAQDGAAAGEAPAAAEDEDKMDALKVQEFAARQNEPVVQFDKAVPSVEGGAPGSAGSSAGASPSSDVPQTSLQATSGDDAAVAGGSEDPSTAAADRMGFTAAPSEGTTVKTVFEWTSPDGKYTAKVEDERMKVFAAADGKLVFQSDEHEGAAVGSVRWEDDSSALHYAWTDSNGEAKAWTWNAGSGLESMDEAGSSVDGAGAGSGAAADTGSRAGTGPEEKTP